MTIEDTDRRAAENAKGPRVTLKDIEAEISAVSYMRGNHFLQHAEHTNYSDKQQDWTEAAVFTICMVVMKNGFVVTGESAPASAENFNEALGRSRAYEKCVAKIWPLLGYQLRDKLHRSA